jgi:hypothetical protein
MTNQSNCECPNGSYEKKHTAECYETEIAQLRGNLSLAEEGLAAATQETQALKVSLHLEVEMTDSLQNQITGLRKALTDIKRVRYGLEMNASDDERAGYWQDMAMAYRQIASDALGSKSNSAEPSEPPQAPIAKIIVRESCAGHYAPDDVSVSLYAPGLPPGEHDVFCEPMSVAPALKSGADLCAVCDGVFIDHRHGALGHDWQPK